jgi:hypothetical protein
MESLKPKLLFNPDFQRLYQVSYIFSEWLLFNANAAIFQLYHGVKKLIFNEMMMMTSLF